MTVNGPRSPPRFPSQELSSTVTGRVSGCRDFESWTPEPLCPIRAREVKHRSSADDAVSVPKPCVAGAVAILGTGISAAAAHSPEPLRQRHWSGRCSPLGPARRGMPHASSARAEAELGKDRPLTVSSQVRCRFCWCGGSRIRTLEGISRWIYSPLPECRVVPGRW